MFCDASEPSLSARFQSSDHAAISVLTRSSSIIFCQNATALAVPSSVKSIETFVPSTWNGRPPACQMSDSRKNRSFESCAM